MFLQKLVLLLLASGCADAWNTLRKEDNAPRGLQGRSYYFLVSGNDDDWCITASRGTDLWDRPELRRCDFDDPYPDELWRIDDDGKIHSAEDDSVCMVSGYDAPPSEGVYVRLAPCGGSTNYNEFTQAGDQLRIRVGSTNYCLTHRGENADPGDTIHMKRCTNSNRYDWDFVPSNGGGSPPPDYYELVSDEARACIVVQNAEPFNAARLIFGTCGRGSEWFWDRTTKYFHSSLDPDRCMQAGRPNEAPRQDTSLRLYPCGESNSRQRFDWDGNKIRLSGSNLCVAYHGNVPNINQDDIVLQYCDNGNSDEEWSAE